MSKQSDGMVGGRVIASRLSTTKSITSAVTALVVCIGLFIWLNSLGLRLIRGVKTGHPHDYPGITYEDAFSKFYDNPKWENASSGDRKVVRFSGECQFNGERAKVVLNYKIQGDEFRLDSGTVNGEEAVPLVLYWLDRQPFEIYKK